MKSSRASALTIGSIAALLIAASMTFGQDATPVFPSSDLSWETVWKSLLARVDPGVLAMLTVIAGGVHRVAVYWLRPAVSTSLLIGLPIVGGGFLGGLSALAKAQMTTGGWLEISRLVSSMAEGATVYAGMAIVLGALLSVIGGGILTKLNVLPSPPPATP